MNASWITVAAPPTGVHVHDDMSGPRHPLTPGTIRAKRGSELHLDCVAWRLESLCGLIVGISERTWQAKDVDRFVLSFCRPAKGGGSVSISIVANDVAWPRHFITSSKNYSDEQLAWSRTVMQALTQLGFVTEEKDEGSDS